MDSYGRAYNEYFKDNQDIHKGNTPKKPTYEYTYGDLTICVKEVTNGAKAWVKGNEINAVKGLTIAQAVGKMFMKISE